MIKSVDAAAAAEIQPVSRPRPTDAASLSSKGLTERNQKNAHVQTFGCPESILSPGHTLIYEVGD